MTNDEAIYVLKNTAWLGSAELVGDVTEAVKMAVEALKRETSDDAIDRQAAIRIASGYCHPSNVAKELAKLPSVQPVDKDINVSCKDAISRQGAIDHFKSIADATSMGNKYNEGFVDGLNFAVGYLETMPSVHPERTCVNCGRTVNNGGWYADGGTRCPIEEHYALPKDGFCHLWEKRNVTDDDYPERRTDEGD